MSFPGGPTETTINHRGGWSNGDVQDRYGKATAGGDQFVGRVLAGLPIDRKEFNVLPVTFADGQPTLSADTWTQLFPCFDLFPSNFRPIFRFLLASLVFHRKFLSQTLSSRHPFFSTRLWTSGILNSLHQSVFLEFGQSTVSPGLKATGLPAIHVLVSEVDALRKENAGLASKIDEFKGSVTSSFSNIERTLPISLAETINDRFTFNGQQPLTQFMVGVMIDELKGTLTNLIQATSISNLRSASSSSSSSSAPSSSTASPVIPDYQTFSHGGKIGLFLPPNFIFPR